MKGFKLVFAHLIAPTIYITHSPSSFERLHTTRDGSYRELEEAAARWGQERAELQREVARLSAGLEASHREVDKGLEVNKQLRCESMHDAERSIGAGHHLVALLLSQKLLNSLLRVQPNFNRRIPQMRRSTNSTRKLHGR